MTNAIQHVLALAVRIEQGSIRVNDLLAQLADNKIDQNSEALQQPGCTLIDNALRLPANAIVAAVENAIFTVHPVFKKRKGGQYAGTQYARYEDGAVTLSDTSGFRKKANWRIPTVKKGVLVEEGNPPIIRLQPLWPIYPDQSAYELCVNEGNLIMKRVER